MFCEQFCMCLENILEQLRQSTKNIVAVANSRHHLSCFSLFRLPKNHLKQVDAVQRRILRYVEGLR